MSKHLGTLNVHAGDAGDIAFEITTDTPIERVAAVLRFADDMTTDTPAAAVVAEPAAAPDPPPACHNTEGDEVETGCGRGRHGVRRVRPSVLRLTRTEHSSQGDASPCADQHRPARRPGAGFVIGRRLRARRAPAALLGLRLRRGGHGVGYRPETSRREGTRPPANARRAHAAHASRRRRPGSHRVVA